MIGNGTPSNQSNAPFPKSIVVLLLNRDDAGEQRKFLRPNPGPLALNAGRLIAAPLEVDIERFHPMRAVAQAETKTPAPGETLGSFAGVYLGDDTR
jgi:hypothetical protein